MAEKYKEYETKIVNKGFGNCLNEEQFNEEIKTKTVNQLVKEWENGYREQERIQFEMEMEDLEDSNNEFRDQEEQIRDHVISLGTVSNSDGNDITNQYCF